MLRLTAVGPPGQPRAKAGHGPRLRTDQDWQDMPRLSTFYGIVVYMYIRDHGVPHIHAWHGDDKAVVEVATGAVLAGSLKSRQASLIREWTDLHRVELLEAWRRANSGEPPGSIEPLP
jgi:uncharacterized protein DUF4160